MDVFRNLSTADAEGLGDFSQLAYVKCSRKGCQASATAEVLWNNPKVHTPDRLKSWAACPEHVVYLQDFLVARSFWKQTRALAVDGLSGESVE